MQSLHEFHSLLESKFGGDLTSRFFYEFERFLSSSQDVLANQSLCCESVNADGLHVSLDYKFFLVIEEMFGRDAAVVFADWLKMSMYQIERNTTGTQGSH